MAPLGQKYSLDTLPSDVISQVTLHTVSTTDTPTPRELRTLHSLLLTCRRLYHKLSLKYNSYLYANIFRCMFDIEAVRRRLGREATVSSMLASELIHRVLALRRTKTFLDGVKSNPDSGKMTSSAWIRLFLMMMEDDGKNRHHLTHFVDISRLRDTLCVQPLRVGPFTTEIAREPHLCLVIAMMWMSSNASLKNENSDQRAAILDFLQPFVLGTSLWSSTSNVSSGVLPDYESAPNIDYFGRRCRLNILPLTSFARLCTVARYKAAKEGIQPGGTCTLGATPSFSARFDNDWLRYISAESKIPTSSVDRFGCPTQSCETLSAIEGLWDGAWFLPCRIDSTPQTVMCAQQMQCHIREYVCPENPAALIEGRADDDPASANAWFPKGVVFDETATSLRVYDPVSEHWTRYRRRSELDQPNKNFTVFDTILIGNTGASHGVRYGEYTFHGRVRRVDGRVVLVRKPADPRMDTLGTWVFRGQIHGQLELVGDWGVTSTVAHTPAGKGWFHLSKVMNDSVSDT